MTVAGRHNCAVASSETTKGGNLILRAESIVTVIITIKKAKLLYRLYRYTGLCLRNLF